MNKIYPLFKAHIPIELALQNIRTVFESGFINEGEQVTQLTNEFKKIFKTDNIILTNSCTSAITLALHLSNVKYDDEVITTPMTCVASNTPIKNLGAKIVWADVIPENGMLDPQSVLRKITSRTKAVIVVAWAGTPPELRELRKICDDHNIKLILDAAHAFGAKYENIPIHYWADYTTYSFQAIKHITTGDGGALICYDEKDYQRSKSLKWFGLDRDHAKDEKGNWKGQQWDVDIIEAGYKFNMNNISAAIGLAQLKDINNIIEKHKENAKLYDTMFYSTDNVRPLLTPKNSESSHWVYTMTIDERYCQIKRDELVKNLNNEGIMAGIVHVPNDNYTAFNESKSDLPGVRKFSSNQFSLPCGWWLNENDISHIAKRVLELVKKC